MARILIIDDDALVRKSLSRLFRDRGHSVIMADTLATGITEADKGVDVVYLDLDLPDGDGLQVIDELASAASNPEVIVITGMGSSFAARKSMESSAWDYISKPASPSAVLSSLDSALAYRREAKKYADAEAPFIHCGIIGESAQMVRSLQDIAKSAASEAGVLIRGETGVGKELAARAIHENSTRRKGPFVVVDCSNLSESLVESVLYGHIKGAFTGAHSDRKGLVAEADGGTLFLDEVGELPPSLQKSFLRVLQERRYRSVGSNRELSSDFRLVAATNRDLAAMAQRGDFRTDLLYRLRTVEILLPPLRDRGEDISRLAAHFIEQTCDRYGLDNKSASSELLKVVEKYSWPGNVREMMNVMEAAVIQAGSAPVIYPKHLASHVRLAFLNGDEESASVRAVEPSSADKQGEQGDEILRYNEYKRERDRDYFLMLMRIAGHDVTKASSISGLSVPSVYRHLSLAGISTKGGN